MNEQTCMVKSTHRAEVVAVQLEARPNADSLSIVRIFDGYTCCVRTADWAEGQLAAYIPPDSVVDSTRPEFAFLAGHERIHKIRLAVFDLPRGAEWIPAPEARAIGHELPWVPLIHSSLPFSPERVLNEAEGPSLIPGAHHVREGIVVKPVVERTHPAVGRVCLKVVGNGYLERLIVTPCSALWCGPGGDGRLFLSTASAVS